MSSFLDSSLSSLETYIINQAPVYSKESHQAANADIFEIDPENDENCDLTREETDVPYYLKKLNDGYTEFLDLSNPYDVESLLSVDQQKWYTVSPEIEQCFNKYSNYDIPLILNFYLRSIPEIQAHFIPDRKLHTKVGPNTFRYILKVLIDMQWFKAASYILQRRNLGFNELVNILNEIIEENLIFQKSEWMRFIFLINFYQVFKSYNPLVLSNLDFLSSKRSTNLFKVLNLMYNKQYESKSELANDFHQMNNICKNDKLIRLMYIYKSVDVIKKNNLFQLQSQMSELKKLINSSSELLSSNLTNASTFMSSVLQNIVSINELEFKYANENNIKYFQIKKFLTARKNQILEYALIHKTLPVKSLDLMNIAQLAPQPNISLFLWGNYAQGKSSLKDTVYYRIIIEKLIQSLGSEKKLDEILKVEFMNLSSNRKIRVLTSTLSEYFKKDNMLTRNRVGGYIALTNNQIEHSHVMKSVVQNLFCSKRSQFKYPDLLKFLELISCFSPTTTNKQTVFELCNGVIDDYLDLSTRKQRIEESKTEINIEERAFFVFSESELFDKTVKFFELIKSYDSDAMVYLAYLKPATTKMLRKRSEPFNEIELDAFLKSDKFKIFHGYLNETFDMVCLNPRSLALLNPKNYPSKIYITYQGLLQKLAIELLKLPPQLLFSILQSRAHWICLDDNDWIFKFNKTVFTFGIFLEVLFRRGSRNINTDFSNLNKTDFKKQLEKETRKLSHNKTVWESIELLSGFEMDDNMRNILADENVFEASGEKIGAEIANVLDELKIMKGVNYIDRYRAISRKNKRGTEDDLNIHTNIDDEKIIYGNDDNHNQQINTNISDLLFDSINDLPMDQDTHSLNDQEIDENGSKDIIPRGLLEHDLLGFNELYQNLKNYQSLVHENKRTRKYDVDGVVSRIQESKLKDVKVKKRYTFKEKERLVRLYSPLRVKSLLIESLIKQNPQLIDMVIRRLFTEYDSRIPVSLIHSAMIGLIKSNCDKIGFMDKIHLVRVLDVLVSVIYSGASKRTYSYLFMKFVRFKDYRVSLVDLIIKESSNTDSGSLKTLNWAMNKITDSSNLKEYKADLDRWTNELNNMKESQTGFWNPSNARGRWIDNRDVQ